MTTFYKNSAFDMLSMGG